MIMNYRSITKKCTLCGTQSVNVEEVYLRNYQVVETKNGISKCTRGTKIILYPDSVARVSVSIYIFYICI